jgi:hypothetical protein
MESPTHDDLNFVATDERFYLFSTRSTEVLEVDRVNFDIKLSRKLKGIAGLFIRICEFHNT